MHMIATNMFCLLVAVLLGGLFATATSSPRPSPQLPHSWDTVPYSVQCHNFTGPLSSRLVALMANAGFATIGSQQCQHCFPNNTGAEDKMAAALRQIRSVNPKAVVLAYSTSDTIRWYTDLGEMRQEKRVRCGEGERG